MKIAAEISMYPLHQDYEPPIIAFIQRLQQTPGLEIHTNQLSTQVAGDYELVMRALQEAMRPDLAQDNSVSFVIKILNVDIQPGQQVDI